MNDKHELIPYVKIGQLQFGMPRSEVRNLLGNFRDFLYGFPIRDNFADDFGKRHALYDKSGMLEAVEFFGSFDFSYLGEIVNVSTDARELMVQLRRITDDIVIIKEDESISIRELGFIVFCPDYKIENILFYRQDYYDN